MKKRWRTDYRHWLCVGLTLASVSLSVLCYTAVAGRALDSLTDFGTSLAYYFCKLLGLPVVLEPTLNRIPETDIAVALPAGWDAFTTKCSLYWRSMLNGQTYGLFFGGILGAVKGVLLAAASLALLVPILMLIRWLRGRESRIEDNRDSRPLRIWKAVTARTVRPAGIWLRGFRDFVAARPGWWKLWLAIWAYNLNLITIGFELLAFLFYFVSSLDFTRLYVQVYKLALDLGLTAGALPWYVWAVAALPVFQAIRHRIGLKRQRRYEVKNGTVRAALPLVTVITGPMNTGKTTHMVDLALSFEADWREQAYGIMLKQDLKFPAFPWINFERELYAAMARREVFNLVSARVWVEGKRDAFEDAPSWATCWDYDYCRYGLDYNDGLTVETLFDVLTIYAQAYLIYVMESSLLVANLSIRTDGQKLDRGGLPLWDYDFFTRDPGLIDFESRHAHILDFDLLRLGRKMAAENPIANSLEFGIFCVTEFGKERGNQYELEGLKKDADETNQKNDRFNWTIKMCRNPATIDNVPFFRMVTDEQRANSLPADLRELMTLVTIGRGSRRGLCFPLFSMEALFCDWFCGKFAEWYRRRRFLGTDNTLGEYLIHGAAARLEGYTSRIYNRYGFTKTALTLTGGANDQEATTLPYYLAPKKIYARRFATDFFGQFFAERALGSGLGIDDYPEYASERADVVELASQHSYMMTELTATQDEQRGLDDAAAEEAARRELIDELLRTQGKQVINLKDVSKTRTDLLKRTYDDPEFLKQLIKLSGREPPT